MKRTFLYGILWLALVAVVFLLISSRHGPPAGGPATAPSVVGGTASASNPTAVNSAGAPASVAGGPAQAASSGSPASATENIAARAGELVADTNSAGDLAPAIVLRNVSHAVREYGNMFGGNPVGLNSEITAALAGQNPKHVNFIDQSAGMQINGKGELVDPWGTPYFFHQLSGSDMEIHSAGPDRIMWTADDLVIH